MRPVHVALIAVIALVFIATGGVLVAGALWRERVTFVAAEPVQAESAQRPAEERDPLAVGTTGAYSDTLMLWVDDTGLRAYSRAWSNRDERGMQRALELWEWIDVPAWTPLRVTNRSGDIVQFEITGGQHQGRRGWSDNGKWFRPQE